MQENHFSEKNFIKVLKRSFYKISGLDVNKDVQINMQTYLHEDLRLDSLDIIRIIIDLETKYNIVTPDESHNQIKTVNDIYNMFKIALVNKTKQKTVQNNLQNIK